MIEAKQIVCAFALFGLYALVASIVPHFKSQTAVFVAMFEYNALSVLVWSCLVGLVKWMLRGSDGQLQWNIPIQWYQRLESGESWPRGFIHANGRLIGGSAGAYKQVFNISANGTVKITKHDHWIERNTNDVIRLDGVEVHDGGHRR